MIHGFILNLLLLFGKKKKKKKADQIFHSTAELSGIRTLSAVLLLPEMHLI